MSPEQDSDRRDSTERRLEARHHPVTREEGSLVEPRANPARLQVPGQLLREVLVSAVVGQEDVVLSPSGACDVSIPVMLPRSGVGWGRVRGQRHPLPQVRQRHVVTGPDDIARILHGVRAPPLCQGDLTSRPRWLPVARRRIKEEGRE